MTASEMYVNTVQFRFPVGSPRPTWVEIANFLKQLDTDLLLMETAYKTAHDRSLFVKLVSLEAMEASLGKNSEPRKFVYSSGKSVEVRMSIAGANMRYVRIFDLPPELKDDRLSLVLGEFGKIERVIREKFPAEPGLDHMYTGVRGVYMEVEESIPPTIDVVGLKGRVFYEELKDTCFLCHADGHRKNACPLRLGTRKNDQRKERKEKSEDSSYAGVVAGKVTVPVEQVPSNEASEEMIEVLEEEFIDQASNASDTEQEAVKSDEMNSQGSRRCFTLTAEKVELAAKAIQELMGNPQANQRRTQSVASHSSSGSGSGSRPKKKCARKALY